MGFFEITKRDLKARTRRKTARRPGVHLIDGDELVKLIFQHYDQFDSRYKGLLPLRRVYVPEAIETDDE